MQNRLKALKSQIRATVARRTLLEADLSIDKEKYEIAAQREQAAIVARELVIEVANRTQQKVGKRISELVSLCLAAVWEDSYELLIDFVQRRGSTEADLWFVRNGHRVEPLFASGGGVVDVASVALRFSVWSLNKTRPVFIFDEPFRNLHGREVNERASIMLQELSKRMGIQIIMATASHDMVCGADKVFNLTSEGVKEE